MDTQHIITSMEPIQITDELLTKAVSISLGGTIRSGFFIATEVRDVRLSDSGRSIIGRVKGITQTSFILNLDTSRPAQILPDGKKFNSLHVPVISEDGVHKLDVAFKVKV